MVADLASLIFVIGLGELRLVEMSASTPKALSEFYGRNKSFHQPFSPIRDDSFYTEEQWRTRFEQYRLERYKASPNEIRMLTVNDSGRVLAEINVTNIVRGPFQACFLGYSVDKEVQGRGVMTKSLPSVLGYCFDNLKLNRVMANTMLNNERSIRVLERLGFEREGIARRYLKLNGSWCDHYLFSKLNPHPED